MDELTKAFDAHRRKELMDAVNAGYAEMRADPEAWAEHLAEREVWEQAISDGLEFDEIWTDDGRCVNPEPA